MQEKKTAYARAEIVGRLNIISAKANKTNNLPLFFIPKGSN
jgi:hypothetical protein